MKLFLGAAMGIFTFFNFSLASGADLAVGQAAPNFIAKNQNGKSFELNNEKGHYVVLFFYPKAGTPGCTKQVCAFRDHIEKIKVLGASVYGISADTVQDQLNFHQTHHLAFDLLADPDDKIIQAYGSKMPALKLSKRWTFILDEKLIIRAIEKDVDPAADAEKVAALIEKLKHS